MARLEDNVFTALERSQRCSALVWWESPGRSRDGLGKKTWVEGARGERSRPGETGPQVQGQLEPGWLLAELGQRAGGADPGRDWGAAHLHQATQRPAQLLGEQRCSSLVRFIYLPNLQLSFPVQLQISQLTRGRCTWG